MIGIFIRTFGQLFAPYVLAAVAAAQIGDYNLTRTQVFVGAVMALAGAIVAVLATLTRLGVATNRLDRALRSAAEKAIVVFGAVVVNSVAEIFLLWRVLTPGLIGIVGAFLYTYLANTDVPPASDPPPAPA